MALEQRVDRVESVVHDGYVEVRLHASLRGDDIADEVDLDLRVRLPPEEWTEEELIENALNEACEFLRELAAGMPS